MGNNYNDDNIFLPQESITAKKETRKKNVLDKDERINARVSTETKAALITMAKLRQMSISEYLALLIENDVKTYTDKEKFEDICLNEHALIIGKNEKKTEDRKGFYEENMEAEVQAFVQEAEKYFGMPIDQVPPAKKRDYLEEKYYYITEEMSRYAIHPICKVFHVERLTIYSRIKKKEIKRRIIREAKADTGKTLDEFTEEEALKYLCKKTNYGSHEDTDTYYQTFHIRRTKFFDYCEAQKEKDNKKA